jgi:hypothetical protein
VVALFVYPFASRWEQRVHFGWEPPWIEEVGILAAIVIVSLLGRLSKEEKAKRRVLGMATPPHTHQLVNWARALCLIAPFSR